MCMCAPAVLTVLCPTQIPQGGFVPDGFVSTAGQGVSVTQKAAVAALPDEPAGPMPQEYVALLEPLTQLHTTLHSMTLSAPDKRKLKEGDKAMVVLERKLSHRALAQRVIDGLQTMSAGACKGLLLCQEGLERRPHGGVLCCSCGVIRLPGCNGCPRCVGWERLEHSQGLPQGPQVQHPIGTKECAPAAAVVARQQHHTSQLQLPIGFDYCRMATWN